MKKILLFCGLGLVMLSCEHEKEKKDSYMKVSVVASRQPEGVDIRWYSPFYMKMMIIAAPMPEAYEVFLAKGDPDHFTRVTTVSASDSAVWHGSNLQNGSYYYAYVKSVGDEANPAISDTVMFIPLAGYALEAIGPATEPMESGTLSSDGSQAVYMNRYFTWGGGLYSQPALFNYNTATGTSEIIDTGAYFPDWSADGKKLVYCSDEHEVTIQNMRPQQLVLYDVETSQVNYLTSGTSFNTNPEFSPDGEWIAYVSDEGHSGSFDIWRIHPDGSGKTTVTSNLGLTGNFYGNLSLGRPSWSADAAAIYFNRYTTSRNTTGIFRIAAGGGNIVPVIQSPWLDVAPAVSPGNDKLAFFSNRTGADEIWMADLETGKLTQVTGTTGVYMNTSWTKIEWLDATTLVFGGYSAPDQQYHLYRLEL